MSNFRLILVLLCIGLLGATPFIISLPRPALADARPATLAQMRPEIGPILQQVMAAQNCNEALKLVDILSAIPDKTNVETQEINQVINIWLGNCIAPKK